MWCCYFVPKWHSQCDATNSYQNVSASEDDVGEVFFFFLEGPVSEDECCATAYYLSDSASKDESGATKSILSDLARESESGTTTSYQNL